MQVAERRDDLYRVELGRSLTEPAGASQVGEQLATHGSVLLLWLLGVLRSSCRDDFRSEGVH